MVWRCLAPLKARGNIKNVKTPLNSAYFMKICKITKDSAIFFKNTGKLELGPSKTINNPLGLLSFGTAGAQDGGNSIDA